jgi:2-hydroxy-6-oxonona-2,4-dienedioate hydrolase
MKRILLACTVLALLVCSGVYLRYRADLAAVRQQLDAGARIVETPCGRVEYATSGQGPAVLVVHGAGGGYSQVADIVDLLAASGFRAIAMSRFGYQRTPLPADGSPAAQADAHACLLDALGEPRSAVIGLSAGAPSAIQFCVRHGDRCTALVLLVPAIAVPGRDVEDTIPPSPFWQFVFNHVLQSDFVIWAITRLRPEILIETVLATPLPVFREASGQEQERALATIRNIFPVSVKRAGLENDARATTPAPMPHLDRITAPTLAISAEDDLYGTHLGATFAASKIAGAQTIIFRTGGHAWLGHDDEVREALVAFLDAASRQ